MPIRTADAVWNGRLASGSGTMNMKSGAFAGAYSAGSRFEEEDGTNPEELIAAAHAGCFSMALAAGLSRAGYEPEQINTTAKVHINRVESGFRIQKIELHTEATVPGIGEEEFQEQAKSAKEGCPVSQALAAVDEITLDARLLQT